MTRTSGLARRFRSARSRILGGRDLLLFTDTGLLSASSVLLLVIAARALPTAGPTAFALAQPLVATAFGTQRTAFLSPGLVAQCSMGRGWIPVLGAVTTPLSAASLALEFQEGAAIIRTVVVVVAAVAGLPLPWNDPTGAVAIFAPTAALVAWFMLCRRATRHAFVEAEGRVVRAWAS